MIICVTSGVLRLFVMSIAKVVDGTGMVVLVGVDEVDMRWNAMIEGCIAGEDGTTVVDDCIAGGEDTGEEVMGYIAGEDGTTVVDCIAGGEDTGEEVMGYIAGKDGTTVVDCIAGGVDTDEEVKPVPGNC